MDAHGSGHTRLQQCARPQAPDRGRHPCGLCPQVGRMASSAALLVLRTHTHMARHMLHTHTHMARHWPCCAQAAGEHMHRCRTLSGAWPGAGQQLQQLGDRSHEQPDHDNNTEGQPQTRRVMSPARAVLHQGWITGVGVPVGVRLNRSTA